MYRVLRERWQIGHIRCQPLYCKPGELCERLRVYGHYPDLQGVIQKTYLGISVDHAIMYVNFRRASFIHGYDVVHFLSNWFL